MPGRAAWRRPSFGPAVRRPVHHELKTFARACSLHHVDDAADELVTSRNPPAPGSSCRLDLGNVHTMSLMTVQQMLCSPMRDFAQPIALNDVLRQSRDMRCGQPGDRVHGSANLVAQ